MLLPIEDYREETRKWTEERGGGAERACDPVPVAIWNTMYWCSMKSPVTSSTAQNRTCQPPQSGSWDYTGSSHTGWPQRAGHGEREGSHDNKKKKIKEKGAACRVIQLPCLPAPARY